MMPVFFMLMILGGIRHPLICASLGALYIVSRYGYFTGYATGDPAKRLTVGYVCFHEFYHLINHWICAKFLCLLIEMLILVYNQKNQV